MYDTDQKLTKLDPKGLGDFLAEIEVPNAYELRLRQHPRHTNYEFLDFDGYIPRRKSENDVVLDWMIQLGLNLRSANKDIHIQQIRKETTWGSYENTVIEGHRSKLKQFPKRVATGALMMRLILQKKIDSMFENIGMWTYTPVLTDNPIRHQISNDLPPLSERT
jgi:hypothetical protein